MIYEIQQAFEAELNSFITNNSLTVQVVGENDALPTSNLNKLARIKHVIAQPAPATFGQVSYTRRGIFEVDLMFPLGKSDAEAAQLADALAGHFHGLGSVSATVGSTTYQVSVDLAYRATAYPGETRFVVPVMINWRVRTA